MTTSRKSRRLTTAIGLGTLALSLLAPASASWADTPTTGQSQNPTVQQFEDVPDNNTFSAFINSLFVSGIISGYPCGGPGEPCGPGNLPYYRPGAAVTRGQMAKFVDNVRHLPNIEITTASYPIPIAASTGNTNGIGVAGLHSSEGGTTAGVQGTTNSTDAFGTGVQGTVNSTSPGTASAGVRGVNNSTSSVGVGVYGVQAGSGWGVYGGSATGGGVFGIHAATTGTTAGVAGQTSSTSSTATGVLGTVSSQAAGSSSAGVRGVNSGTSPNVYGVYGSTSAGTGVAGITTSGTGVYAVSTTGKGLYGQHLGNSGTDPGVYGTTDSSDAGASGVYGEARSLTNGNVDAVKGINRNTGSAGAGVWGAHFGSGIGVYGTTISGIGVYGESSNIAIRGYTYGNTSDDVAIVGIGNAGNALAGKFYGDVDVTGTCCASAMGTFRIDDPQDPENQYLNHAAVASDELLNIYNGIVTLDASGSATVQMPAWFSSINSTFRYQLTAIGDAAPNLHIASKMQGNQFKIGGGVPNIEISWQVTGVRNDPYANANRPIVETAKPINEKGTYLHPELYNQPDSKATYPMPEKPVTNK